MVSSGSAIGRNAVGDATVGDGTASGDCIPEAGSGLGLVLGFAGSVGLMVGLGWTVGFLACLMVGVSRLGLALGNAASGVGLLAGSGAPLAISQAHAAPAAATRHASVRILL